MITIDDFAKIEIHVGKVVKAEEVAERGVNMSEYLRHLITLDKRGKML